MTQSLIIALIPVALAASPSDSLRTETIQGKVWIIHQVDPGETLYRLARRYGVEVTVLTEANPGSDSGLKSGQLIKVPAKSRTTVGTAKAVIKYHVVSEKETLFSLSKQYQVTVSDLLRWNNLTSNELRIGQRLAVSAPVPSGSEKSDNQPSEPIRSVLDESRLKSAPTAVRINPLPDDAQVETGSARLLDGDTEMRKYLAHHRTIPYGTVVRVRNKDSREEIFVRIVGVLSDEESGTVIRLSRAAWEKLGGKDPLNVEVIYFK